MVLFADAQDMTAITVAMAAISALASFGSAYLSYAANRDKLRNDAKLVSLEREVTHLTEKVAVCDADRSSLRKTCDEQQGEINELWRMLAKQTNPPE